MFTLFYTFLFIGLFTFGGGYSMVALIQDEVVVKQQWMSMQEFTDMLAISQMTPGPIGINTATYAGYTSLLNSGHPQWVAMAGAVVASLAVVLLPVALMLLVCHYIQRLKGNPLIERTMHILRLTVVGLIAAAALSLLTVESFGVPGLNRQFICSVLLFGVVFWLSYKKKASPIALIVASGLAGFVVFSF